MRVAPVAALILAGGQPGSFGGVQLPFRRQGTAEAARKRSLARILRQLLRLERADDEAGQEKRPVQALRLDPAQGPAGEQAMQHRLGGDELDILVAVVAGDADHALAHREPAAFKELDEVVVGDDQRSSDGIPSVVALRHREDLVYGLGAPIHAGGGVDMSGDGHASML